MLTYVARPRGLYTDPENAIIEFPCMIEVVFSFEPRSPFGENEAPLRTVPQGANVRLEWNACKGETRLSTDSRLSPILVEFTSNDGAVAFEGSRLKLSFEATSRNLLESVIGMYYYALPAILAIDFIDIPLILEVRGTAGSVSFCWGVLDSGLQEFDTVTTAIQEERIRDALARLRLLDETHGLANRRLLAATQYYFMACRLNRVKGRPGEFLAEVLLNLAKTLEVLFPAPSGQTIEYTRKALALLSFSEIEIESLFVPALALRNTIDVAHPMVSVFSDRELTVLHKYVDKSESAFRLLLRRVFQKVSSGEFKLHLVKDINPTNDAKKLIQRMDTNLSKYESAQQQ